jgi:hypothetical protein
MTENISNDYSTTLNGGITAGAVSLVVNSATGAPAANFRIWVDSELMQVVLVAGTTFTVVRGIEGTTAAAHANGAIVAHVITKGGLDQYLLENYLSLSAGGTVAGALTLTGGLTATAGQTVNLSPGSSSVTISPASGAVTISPSSGSVIISPSSGSVTIAPSIFALSPTSISDIDNTRVGRTTPQSGVFTDLTSTGNTTIGDAAGDTLTLNAGTWTLGNTTIMTRAAGATTSFDGLTFNTTFSDSVGGGTFRAMNLGITSSGANNIGVLRPLITGTVHSGSGTVTTLIGVHHGATLSGSGNVTTLEHFRATTLGLTSSGSVATVSGLHVLNQGHASQVTTAAYGVNIDDFTSGAPITAAYRTAMAAGTNKWGLYFDGTANNYIAGNVRIGDAAVPASVLDIVKTASGSDVGMVLSNSSNTASSSATNVISVGGSSSGDPAVHFVVLGATDITMGIDNSVSGDPWVLAASTTLGSSNMLSCDTSGSLSVYGAMITGAGISTQDASFDLGGGRSGDGNSFIDFHSTSGTDYEFRLLRASGTNGAASIDQLGTGGLLLRSNGADAWKLDSNQQLLPQATLTTTMTTGFLNLPGAAGTPTGVPAATTGYPMFVDSTNDYLYHYNASWKRHKHDAADVVAGTMATARLGSGTASVNTFLRGDQTYARTWNTIVKTADQSKTTDTTIAADSDLTLAVSASKNYRIRFYVYVAVASATPDLKFRITGPTSPTLVNMSVNVFTNESAADSRQLTNAFDSSDRTLVWASGAGTGVVEVEVILQNGANAGNVTIQWAQNSSSANATTVRGGSYIEYTQLN